MTHQCIHQLFKGYFCLICQMLEEFCTPVLRLPAPEASAKTSLRLGLSHWRWACCSAGIGLSLTNSSRRTLQLTCQGAQLSRLLLIPDLLELERTAFRVTSTVARAIPTTWRGSELLQHCPNDVPSSRLDLTQLTDRRLPGSHHDPCHDLSLPLLTERDPSYRPVELTSPQNRRGWQISRSKPAGSTKWRGGRWRPQVEVEGRLKEALPIQPRTRRCDSPLAIRRARWCRSSGWSNLLSKNCHIRRPRPGWLAWSGARARVLRQPGSTSH